MKKRILIAVIFLAFCLLCGCGGASKQTKSPSDDILEAALCNSLIDYAPQQELSDFEIETSLTQETSYTATIKAVTRSRYAEFHNTVSINCTLYDQGWKADSCHWSTDNYNVIAYPSVEEMDEIIQSRNCYVNFDEQQVCTDIIPQGNSFSCRGVKTSQSYYLDENIVYQSVWNYNCEEDNWDLDTFDTVSENIYHNLDGVWKSEVSPDVSAIIISNFSEDEFDVSCTGYNTNTVHVTRQKGTDTFTGSGLTASFTMSYRDYTATDAEICVELCPTGSGIRAAIRFQCDSDMWCFESSLIH